MTPRLAALLAFLLSAPTVAPAEGTLRLDWSPRTPAEASFLQLGLALYDLHETRIDQRGRDNAISLRQKGPGNTALVRQRGKGHRAALRQRGRGNTQVLMQFGRGTSAVIRQEGTARADVSLLYGF